VTQELITLTLSQHEGLVLFEWLVRLNGSNGRVFVDQAEQRVAWDLEAMLESQMSSVLAADYRQRLALARDVVRDADP